MLKNPDINAAVNGKNKIKYSKEIGIDSEVIRYPENIQEKIVLDKIIELNKNQKVSGILVQLPLPLIVPPMSRHLIIAITLTLTGVLTPTYTLTITRTLIVALTGALTLNRTVLRTLTIQNTHANI